MKKTITLISAILLSNAALAGGYGYVIKKQTVNCSPSSQCRLEHISDSANISETDEKKNLTMGYPLVQTKAVTKDKSGIFHQDTELDSTHTVKIVNREAFKKSFEYVQRLECADVKPAAITVVELRPGGVYTSTDRLVAVSKNAPIGRHTINAYTSVFDEKGGWNGYGEAVLTIRAK